MTATQSRDRDHPVDRERGAHTTITVRILDRRRQRIMAPDARRPLRVGHDRHVDLDATAGRGRWGHCY
jgi:hypothetical protein